jgi:hypothetical protein
LDVGEGQAREFSASEAGAREELEDRAVADPDDGPSVGLAQQPLELDVRERAGLVVLDVRAAHLLHERVGAQRRGEAAHGADALCDRAGRETLRGELVAPRGDGGHGSGMHVRPDHGGLGRVA